MQNKKLVGKLLVFSLSVKWKGSHFIHSGTECMLRKFADDTKLSGVVDSLEGRDGMQRELGAFEEHAHMNLMKFKKAKWKSCTWVRRIPCTSADWG